MKNSDALKLAEAYETNLRAYTVALAEAGDGVVHRNDDALLTIFPYTYWINGVVSPCLSPIDTLERINEILTLFRNLEREVWLTLGPSTQPPDLARILKERGFWNRHNRPFMACDLATLVTGFPQPDNVNLHTVEDYDLFSQHPHPLLGRSTTARVRHIFDTFKRLAQQQPRKHWMFIAELDDKPVGVTIIYLDDHNAGIYDVEVLDEFQRRGIGTALVEQVCTFAQAQGAELALLAASEMGASFYKRFGFEQVGRYPLYYYSIKKQKQDATQVS